ncbi:MAG: PTS sugar transporter subunit IIB [Endomicrobiales bacterium]|nr:PTS sugar transporter subunit IIB [Endomicrobiales bacterium]
MTISLVRIDDRLIHGQIVEGWLKNIGVNHIVVVSDEVAGDEMQRVLLTMAVPPGVKVTVLSISAGAEKINGGYFREERILLLLSTPSDVLKLLESGVRVASVNVGGMHYAPGKKQVLRNLSVDDSDISVLRRIHEMNIKLEGRVLPFDEAVDVISAIDGALKGQKT